MLYCLLELPFFHNFLSFCYFILFVFFFDLFFVSYFYFSLG